MSIMQEPTAGRAASRKEKAEIAVQSVSEDSRKGAELARQPSNRCFLCILMQFALSEVEK
jgi:hypothetical protein